MSWLHCMWGVGTTIGPMVMGTALTHGAGWNMGYRAIGLFQMVLAAILIFSLPLWKRQPGSDGQERSASSRPLTPAQILRLPGAKEVMLCFFCYCALESTAGLWASSYLTLVRGADAQTAASFASLFYIGITAGRGVSGFLTLRLNDTQMIRLGQTVLAVGVASLLLPGPQILALTGFVLTGVGCAPIYPSIIHSTPARFGAERSQALIGVQMASAYVGSMLMPPLYGLAAQYLSPALLPVYLLVLLCVMFLMHERLIRTASCS
ncbi:MAG: MFS transporter, partial [Faecalibacterium sp.]